MKKRLVGGLLVVAVAAVGGFALQRLLAPRPSLTATSPPPTPPVPTPAAPGAEPGGAADEAPPHRVIPETLPQDVEVSHVSLFDKTNEGLRLKNKPVFSRILETYGVKLYAPSNVVGAR